MRGFLGWRPFGVTGLNFKVESYIFLVIKNQNTKNTENTTNKAKNKQKYK